MVFGGSFFGDSKHRPGSFGHQASTYQPVSRRWFFASLTGPSLRIRQTRFLTASPDFIETHRPRWNQIQLWCFMMFLYSKLSANQWTTFPWISVLVDKGTEAFHYSPHGPEIYQAELVSCDKLQQVMEVSKSWGYPDRSLDGLFHGKSYD